MSKLTREDILAAVQPKSDQLNAIDVLDGPITVTITGTAKGNADQPAVVQLDGYKPFKPCKSMLRIMKAVFGVEPDRWIGMQMTLYCDEDVYYGKDRTGGVRISHMTDPGRNTEHKLPKTFTLPISRLKKKEFHIEPIVATQKPTEPPPEPTVEEQAFIETASALIQAADSGENLMEIGLMLKEQSQVIRDVLKPIYAARKKELEA